MKKELKARLAEYTRARDNAVREAKDHAEAILSGEFGAEDITTSLKLIATLIMDARMFHAMIKPYKEALKK